MILPKTLPLLAVLLLFGPPDEGQWLPSQVRNMDWEKLRRRGMQLTKDEFWHPEKGGVLTASVQLGGCSASFVSADGLVVTNHHCGFGAINRLSSTGHNYLRDGFVAPDRDTELPARGQRLQIVRKIEDVTKQVHEAVAKAGSPLERYAAEQLAIRRLISQAQEATGMTCSVASMFEGREYHLYYREQITDLRLVYAPPRSIGEFGGEVDNWEWPRHTGDFCFFRAYTAPDGTPRPYHADNVPYKPKHFLRVSAKGVQEGDLVLIMGYPGSTERYLSSEAVKDRQGIYYPLRLELFTGIIKVLEARARASEEKQLQYASLIKSLANVQKNALGMVKGLARNAVVERKLREEEQFRKWLQLDKERQEQWGKILDEVIALDLEARKTQEKELVLGLLSSRLTPFLRHVLDMCSWLERQDPSNEPRAPRDLVEGRGLTRDLKEVQVPIVALLVEAALALPKEQSLLGMEAFAADGKVREQVLDLIEESGLTTASGRRQWLLKGRSALDDPNPLVRLACGLNKDRAAVERLRAERAGRRLVIGPRWIDAQQAWRGTSFYPDANSTMRVSIASVKGYEPRDGIWHRPHTTVGGVIAKFTGKEPFDCPKALLTAAEARKSSQFFDQRIGDVPVCFLSDGDTTGGNSGSPVINGKGELVGLNFDRVFEAVAGDYGWNPDRSRNISVDLRYVLWILEQVQPAPHLLKEMGL